MSRVSTICIICQRTGTSKITRTLIDQFEKHVYNVSERIQLTVRPQDHTVDTFVCYLEIDFAMVDIVLRKVVVQVH